MLVTKRASHTEVTDPIRLKRKVSQEMLALSQMPPRLAETHHYIVILCLRCHFHAHTLLNTELLQALGRNKVLQGPTANEC